jgi:ribosomal protein L40E
VGGASVGADTQGGLPDTAPAKPVGDMPDHFPEIHLDDETGEITIAGTASKSTVAVAQAVVPAETTVRMAPALESPTVRSAPAPATPPVAAAAIFPAVTPPAAAADEFHTYQSAAKYQAEKNVCIRCGSGNLARGYVVDYSNKFTHIHFAPKRMTPRKLNAITTLRPFRNLARVDAIACRDCGAVLLVAEPGEIRRAERRRTDD